MVAFLLEDGTGLEAATSYADIAFSNQYLGSAWAVSSAIKLAALIVGTEYFDNRWGRRLRGQPLVNTQSLEFPRLYLYDRYGRLVEGVPDDVKKAVCLYAQTSLTTSLYPTVSTTSSREVKKEKVSVGPISTETEYSTSKSANAWLDFPAADGFVTQYLGASGRVIRG